MISKIKSYYYWVYAIAILFAILNAFGIYYEFYWLLVIPSTLVLVYLAFFKLDTLVLVIVFFVPLSLSLKDYLPDIGFDMSLPSEPLLFGILIIFVMKLIIEQNFDKRILKHPVSIAIYFNLIWMFITSLTSSLPVVSFKFLLARLWFLVAFYFLLTQIFKNYKSIKRFVWIYFIPLMGVIFYTVIRHIHYGIFDKQVSHWVMEPFYNDHTSYAAILAMFVPLLFGFALKSNYSINTKIIIWPLIVILLIAIVLSYTRAAWISLLGMFGVYCIFLFKIKLRTLFVLGFLFVAVFFVYQESIFMNLERNRQDSSAQLSEHIQSISNISSDASNLERINRWQCALRMFSERPVLGWGPGTYQFQYAPFQFSYERTIISTNAGDMGNAHSEYIGPLSESGVMGTLTFLGIIFSVIYTSIRVANRTRNRDVKMLARTTLLGLTTYYFHGFLNNFLDTDKASVLFWGFSAIIVSLDVYHSKEEQTSDK